MNFAAGSQNPHRLHVYGGVEQDFVAATLPLRTSTQGQPAGIRWMHVPLGLIDLPFSIVADTLSLPWTIPPAPKDSQMEEDGRDPAPSR